MAQQLFKSGLGFATDYGTVIDASGVWQGVALGASKIDGASLAGTNITWNASTGQFDAAAGYTDSDVTSLLSGNTVSTDIKTTANVVANQVWATKFTGPSGDGSNVTIQTEGTITLDNMGFGSTSVTDDLSVGGNLTVTGNFTVNGTTTTLNTATLDVEDLNITVAKGAANSAAANGAGLTIDGANATLTWDNANSRLAVNKELYTSSRFVSTQLAAPSGQDLTLLASSSTRVKIFTGQYDVLPKFDEDVYTMVGTTANQSLGYTTPQGMTKVMLMAETSGGARHAMEVLIVSNGTDANFTTYGEIYTADLGEFSINQLDSNNLEMRFSPTAAGSGCTVTVMRQFAVSQFGVGE